MRKVFVGSSYEALGQLSIVDSTLRNAFNDMSVIPWRTIFPPSTVTFEGIERISRDVAGAILLATPDDKFIIREKQVSVPRANVMLEMGYFSAILGRSRTALCKYDEVTLPTDLNGVTYIAMGPYPTNNPDANINNRALDDILRWARNLRHVAGGIPQINVTHGYSGNWFVEASFMQWRGIAPTPPSLVTFKGYINIYLPLERPGLGWMWGHMNVPYGEGGGMPTSFATLKVTEKITNVQCDVDGKLVFLSELFNLELERADAANPALQRLYERLRNEVRIGWKSGWELNPNTEDLTLTGSCRYGPTHECLGYSQRVYARKEIYA